MDQLDSRPLARTRSEAVETHSATSNRAPAPIAFTAQVVADYAAMGVPIDRLGIVFPWMGCAYACGAASTGP